MNRIVEAIQVATAEAPIVIIGVPGSREVENSASSIIEYLIENKYCNEFVTVLEHGLNRVSLMQHEGATYHAKKRPGSLLTDLTLYALVEKESGSLAVSQEFLRILLVKPGLTVLIVDDISITGITLAAAVRCVSANGAKRIIASAFYTGHELMGKAVNTLSSLESKARVQAAVQEKCLLRSPGACTNPACNINQGHVVYRRVVTLSGKVAINTAEQILRHLDDTSNDRVAWAKTILKLNPMSEHLMPYVGTTVRLYG